MTSTVLVFVLNAAWQSALLLLIGLLLSAVVRKAPAHLEYLVWSMVLLGAALTPWASLITVSLARAIPHVRGWQSSAVADLSLWFGGNTPTALDHAWLEPRHPVVFAMVAIYAAFIFLQMARLCWGLLQLRKILQCATECCDRRVLRLSERFVGIANTASFRVLVSTGARVPFAIGVLRPAIVLPYSLVEHAKDDELAAVLAHEFAHIHRRDWIRNLVLLLISTPVSFHPCVAIMRKKVEASREAACDEFASGYMVSASCYARALLDLAGKLAQPQPSLAAAYKGAALGVLDGSTLGDRIRRLMDRSPRLKPRQTRILFGSSLGTLLIACLAATNFAIASPSSSTSGSVTGVWTGKLTDRSPRVEGATVIHNQAYLQIQQNGSQITGVIGGDAEHNAPIENAALNGNHLHFETTMKHGDEVTHWAVDLVVSGNQMSGTGHALRSDKHSWDVEVDLTRQN